MSKSERLYNLDLAPTSKDKKNWGWFEIFNVWADSVLPFRFPSHATGGGGIGLNGAMNHA